MLPVCFNCNAKQCLGGGYYARFIILGFYVKFSKVGTHTCFDHITATQLYREVGMSPAMLFRERQPFPLLNLSQRRMACNSLSLVRLVCNVTALSTARLSNSGNLIVLFIVVWSRLTDLALVFSIHHRSFADMLRLPTFQY
jgi:hypothetical protein